MAKYLFQREFNGRVALLLSTLFLSFLSSINGAANTIYFSPLAKSSDSTQALQEAINSAIASGPNARLVIPGGTYRLDCNTSTSLQTCLMISGASKFKIEGQGIGSTRILISNPDAGFIGVEGSSNVEIRGLSVDYSSVPFTQGTVRSIDATHNTLNVVLDDGYPRLDSAIFLGDRLHSTFAMNFDPSTTHLKASVRNAYFVNSTSANKDGSWNVNLDNIEGFSVGNRFVLPYRGPHLFKFFRNQNINLHDIETFASPGLVTAWIQNRGTINIDNLQIRRTANRLLSSSADAIHMVDNIAKVSIQNCYIEGMADDAINTRSSAFYVTKVEAPNVLTFTSPWASWHRPKIQGLAIGQKLQVVDPSTQLPRGMGQIVKISHASDGSVRVSLDKGVSKLTAGDMVFIAEFASPNLLLRNNTFSFFRGMFRVRSPGAIFLNNKVEDADNAQVFISVEIAPLWKEGPSLINSLDGVYFDGNYVKNGDFNLLQVNYANAGHPLLSGEESMLAHPLIFDAEFYRSLYPDLAGMSDSDLRTHWILHGIYENRRGSIEFSAAEYLSIYPDLLKAFGSDGYVSAASHFVKFGYILEDRLGSFAGNSLVYNSATYRRLNPDLSGMSFTQLDIHWLLHGISEGRQASRSFWAAQYLERYPDLKAVFGTDYMAAIRHYIVHGLNEGR